MKLFARYNAVNLVAYVAIILVTGLAYYQAISWVLTRQKDKELQNEEQEILDYISFNHHLPQTFDSKYLQITFKEAAPGSVKRRLVDTVYFKKWGKDNPKRLRYHREGDYEAGRGLLISAWANGQYYRAYIVKSKVETEDLLQIIFTITIGVILLLLLVLFISSRLILNRLWQPFYSIMKELKLFNIAEPKEIPKVPTYIDEFEEMNTVVTEMAAKAKRDYQTLKTFTENASHEFLTPIAIINSKLDTLVQTDSYTKKQSKLLDDVYNGVLRLNRLNQSLLLLVKIENNLLYEQQSIDLRSLIEDMIMQFEEIYRGKKIKLNHQLQSKFTKASRNQMEIMFSNLMTNAIRHNYTGGTINICLTPECFTIQNTGIAEPLLADEIFARFHKSASSEGSGLGLTISRQICDNFGLILSYGYEAPNHQFTIIFPSA